MPRPQRVPARGPATTRRRGLAARTPRAAALALATATVIGTTGCGGSVDAAALQKQLTGVADGIDRCVAKTNDARKCDTAGALGSLPAGTKLGDGNGQITIDAPEALRYSLTAKADNKVHFDLVAQPVGARRRLCSPAGEGACPKNGAW